MKRIMIISACLLALTGSAMAQAMAPGDGGPPPPPMGAGDAPPPPPGHRPPPPPPSKAAHFRLEQADMRVDVKCADEEPMKACADIAMQLIDRLGATARH